MRQRQSERPHFTRQQRVAERLYALLLLLYPPTHRRVYGPLMLQTFRDSYRDMLATGAGRGPGFWLGVAGDEVKSLAREHGAALRAEAPRMKRWAAEIASGGVLVGSAVIYIVRCVHR